MKELLNELLMEDKTLIHVPFGNGFFDIYKSVVVTWILLAVVIVLILILTHNLKVHNISKRQAALESAVLWLRGAAGSMLGEEAAAYTDYTKFSVSRREGVVLIIGFLGYMAWLLYLL